MYMYACTYTYVYMQCRQEASECAVFGGAPFTLCSRSDLVPTTAALRPSAMIMCIHIYIYIYMISIMYVCICVYIYIYIYTYITYII